MFGICTAALQLFQIEVSLPKIGHSSVVLIPHPRTWVWRFGIASSLATQQTCATMHNVANHQGICPNLERPSEAFSMPACV
jgi:hypothetical protein